ncbi:MAG: hypothetical protein A3G77_16030 [Acidobacteria bacterium RIFCSPLOWO2_12_FULL_68_19]|nr:MAG: hypothetical protein A3G77_16030 [Acidobacteria bacterium RIFCSPLOWO2_12_FULL_68_19]
MSRSYYELLGVASSAPVEEIKRAFRREIAKYHPDKVQHLGREFQEIAAVKAAELTQAYKTLCDESLRTEYDAGLAAEGRAPGARGRDGETAAPAAGGERWPASAAKEAPQRGNVQAAPAARPRPSGGSAFATDRAGVSDLLGKAALARFRQALDEEFGRCEEASVQGFDVACAPPKGRFWSKLPPRILARVVAHVDAAAVADSWAMATRLRHDDQREVCIFLMGPSVAPAGELARAIAEERRKPAPGRFTLVPLNTRNWGAHIPNDAPPVVKSLVGRLRS